MMSGMTIEPDALNAARPRFRDNGRCAGCGELFADLDAFTLHASGKLNPTIDAKRRCRSTDEMYALGMGKRADGIWIATTPKKRSSLART